MDNYLVPAGEAEAEFTEKRSRFIGRIWRTDNEEEALQCIKRTRERHYDAKHNAYAYIIKDGATRCSDDGEPQGTAGMPVLEVLRRENLINVCCVVTRYFGGVLLGTGGLTRAYARAAKMAVEAAGTREVRLYSRYSLCTPYALFERIRQEVGAHKGIVEDIDFGGDVTVRYLLPIEREAEFNGHLTELSAGKLSPVFVERVRL